MAKATQKAILPTENNDLTAAHTKSTVYNFSKSKKKTSLTEFAVANGIRPEVKAGFKVWLHGEYYHFDEEWGELFNRYINR